MSKSQRTKGHSFEREIANNLTELLGRKVQRHLGQARDGGDDITLSPFRLECKRYAKIAVYKWLEQVIAACGPGDIPVVIAKADHQDPIAILRYSDFRKLLVKELNVNHL